MLRLLTIAIFPIIFSSCRNYDIQKIEFHTSGCFGTCPVFTIKIDKNKHASYTAVQFNQDNDGKDIAGAYTTVVDSTHYGEIQDLLAEIDFPQLHDKYEVRMTDQATATLSITYDNGKRKVIEDYGEQATFQLEQLYEMLTALRLNQNWH